MANYEPSLHYVSEWWKQLYGESEGKNGIGIFPASVEYNADLHSMGQYIQDGPRTLMETVVSFEQPQNEFTVPFAMGDPDRLNYLAGRKLSDISRMAQEAVKAAHIAGACRIWRCACRSATRPGLPGSCASSSWHVPFRAICPASIRSISPAWKHIRRICSLCSASRRQTEKSYRCSRRENVLI